ncbi:MAG: RluA family pseudouridine synthase [Gammaproteobacteria bacterium]|nr:RluA family pseudouridine synthase [Gammaproteobacteria bacterium]
MKNTEVQQITVGAEHAGQRIDNFLMTRLKGVPRSHVYQVLRTGQVRVNKGRIKPVYRLQAGDVVRIPPLHVTETRSEAVPESLCRELEQRILYEDDELLILDKPAGLAVHGGENLRFGVIEALRQLRGPGLDLVHRLDRATSGCLLVAKNRQRLKALHELFIDRRMHKQYLALLKGAWRGGERTITAGLQRQGTDTGRRRTVVDDDGKASSSTFRPLQRYPLATLMQVDLGSGRMHQIRVHAEHSGHPVAGDDKYGDFAFNRQLRKLGLKRMFLHAARLEFTVPWQAGRTIRVEAPLDAELQQVLSMLEQQGDDDEQ